MYRHEKRTERSNRVNDIAQQERIKFLLERSQIRRINSKILDHRERNKNFVNKLADEININLNDTLVDNINL